MIADKIAQLRFQFQRDLEASATASALEALKVQYLGKKGPVTALMQELKGCTRDEKPHFGKLINDLKEELLATLEEKLTHCTQRELSERLMGEWLDPTLPGRRPPLGRIHPIQQMLRRVLTILSELGFAIRLGPDVDTEENNFTGLNFAPDHPARDLQDTFYLNGDRLLRTHTSNVQVHALRDLTPPMRIAAPGRCFRNEDISARSHVFFHQVESFALDAHLTFADLLSTLQQFLTRLFGAHVKTRFRPSYFPFVEPGLEVDVSCTACSGRGCRLCKHTGWLEILGAGMIHPKVLSHAHIDPEHTTGFAWGLGIERLALLHWDIPDIRLFTQNDVRFLRQL